MTFPMWDQVGRGLLQKLAGDVDGDAADRASDLANRFPAADR